MRLLWVATGMLLAAACLGVLWQARRRNVALWLPAYVKRNWPGRRGSDRGAGRGPVHIMFCIADHFEPGLFERGIERERRRVEHWLRHYPGLASRFRDADGRPPRHTFFYPAEQYRAEHLERLATPVRAGYGEVEVHLHHDGDTSAGLRQKLLEFAERLHGHGHLGTERAGGAVRFGFIHGNWALDNSRPDGRWCGVNDELRVLRQCGCYADFTFPSAPSPTQTRRINSIYYATDDPARPKSHDDGVEVCVGGEPGGDLMLIQGPLGLTWPGGRFGLLPRIETAGIAAGNPPTLRRVASWVRARVCVAGRPDWLFVKVHTHGCKEANWDVLFGPPMQELHRHLAQHYNDGRRYTLHYVTAREMYNIVKAAERGLAGDPGEYRDLEVLPPPLAVGERCGGRIKQEAIP